MSIAEIVLRRVREIGSEKKHVCHVTARKIGTRAKAWEGDATSAWRRARCVENQANTALRSSSYHPVRNVSCEVRERVLILRGRVPSFYMKQVAQTVVRDQLDDGFGIENRVEVD